MSNSRDLFDDSTMSFGEHLEVLRVHLIKAILGLFMCVTFTLFFGKQIINVVRSPIDKALQGYDKYDSDVDNSYGFAEVWDDTKSFFDRIASGEFFEADEEEELVEELPANPNQITVTVQAGDLAKALNDADIQLPEDAIGNPKPIQLTIEAPEFAMLQRMVERSKQTVALNVQEAFLTYLKVSFMAGFVIASPWVFYQLWLFVAAGLYPNERHYVYIYLPVSLTLFTVGALFCFFAVFPFVLHFLLSFNEMIGAQPQIRLSEWISFAIMLPVMFGLSFQLPVVMLFLERISIFNVEDYRTRRRMAILIISIVSMFLTPADPMSMLMMMIPLIGLYEMGILLSQYRPQAKTPFDGEAA